jgi:Ribbon-helix-helix protein, copG family
MRTTVSIDDHLLAEAKQEAARSHRSLGAVIEDALRRALSDDSGSVRAPVELPTHGNGGVREGVDLDDKMQLAELLGDNDAQRVAP